MARGTAAAMASAVPQNRASERITAGRSLPGTAHLPAAAAGFGVVVQELARCGRRDGVPASQPLRLILALAGPADTKSTDFDQICIWQS